MVGDADWIYRPQGYFTQSSYIFQALTNFNNAAAQGHTESGLQLGLMYLNGVGVTKDYGQALKHFNTASKAGESSKTQGKIPKGVQGTKRRVSNECREWHEDCILSYRHHLDWMAVIP